MARLRTIGWETKALPTTAFNTDTMLFEGGNTLLVPPAVEVTTVRSGIASAKCDSGINNDTPYTQINLTAAEQSLGRGYYTRCYFNFATLSPSTNIVIMAWGAGGGQSVDVRLTTSNTLILVNDNGGAQIGSASSALSPNTWYRVELFAKIGVGAVDAAELQLDGVSVAAGSGLTISDATLTACLIGWITSPDASRVVYLDDCAINDDQGANQNSWPGSGKIVLLKPNADNAVGTGWVDGDGAGTLFNSVNNSPPKGTTTPAGGTQIKNLTSTATGNYDATMTTYAAKGVAAADTITLVQAICETGEAATGVKLGALQIVSNPAQAVEDGFTYGLNVGVRGVWPSNWRASWGTAQYSPSVSLAVSPVLRVGKRTASVAQVEVDVMGIYVEYVPGVVVATSGHRLGLLGVGH